MRNNRFILRVKLASEMIIGLLVVLVILAISKFIEVRIGRINNKVIGHFAQELDVSNLLNMERRSSRKIINLWYLAHYASVNKYFEKLVREKFKIIPRLILVYAYNFFMTHSKFHNHVIQSYDSNVGLVNPGSKKIDPLFWVRLSEEPALFSVSDSEMQKSKELLSKLGSSKLEFACLHIRDNQYKSTDLRRRGYSESHIASTEVRSEHRNSSFEKFNLGCNLIIENGIAPVRVGRDIKSVNSACSNVILDYTDSAHVNDQNDILLAANCKFMICTLSGFSEVSKIFRIPVFYLDVGEFSYFASKITSSVKTTPIILPKVVKFRSNDRVLNFQEIYDLGLYELSTVAFEEYISKKNCPIVVEENSASVIAKTIELGIKFLDKRSKKTDTIFESGQILFSQLYKIKMSENLPAISPFWPNANDTKSLVFD
jgi:putative glycosyltransferase (TIGR04372 family)